MKNVENLIKLDRETAMTLFQSLGGTRSLVMLLGAKNLMIQKDRISFRIPSTLAKGGVNYIAMGLNGSDLFEFEFGKIRGDNYKVVSEHSDVYLEDVIELFWQELGLTLIMPRFV